MRFALYTFPGRSCGQPSDGVLAESGELCPQSSEDLDQTPVSRLDTHDMVRLVKLLDIVIPLGLASLMLYVFYS